MTRQYYPDLDENVCRETLPNGLRIAVVPRKGFARSIAYFVTGFGSIHTEFTLEGERHTVPAGVAHYLEHKMFELPGDRDVTAEFAALGASANAFTSYDMTAYYFTCTQNFEAALRLLLEFVSTPYFTRQSVERERGIIQQEIDMNLDSPDSVIFDRLMEALYANHPVRVPILGTGDSIRQITPALLECCHRAFYHPGNMLLCVIGDVEPESVAAIARETLPDTPKPQAEKRSHWEEADTPVHRLDPRTKLLCVILYIVALFSAKSLLTYGIMITVLAVSVLVSRVPFKSLTKGLKPVYFVVAFTAVMNMFFTAGTPVADVWLLRSITWEGVVAAVQMVLRIVMLIMGTFLMTYTTSPIALTDGMESLLGPLKKLRLPIHELAMMMSIALRFIPTLIEETDKIMSAQKARGADFETGNIFRRAKALVPILVPLFISAFRRADELATAMECRCYHGGEGRTALRVLRYKAADWLVLAAFLALTAGIIVLKKLGF